MIIATDKEIHEIKAEEQKTIKPTQSTAQVPPQSIKK